MDFTSRSPTPAPSATPSPASPPADASTPERQSLMGQNGLDAARRRSPEFARMLTESAELLSPDPQAAEERIIMQNLIDQTAAVNVIAARSSTFFNPAIIGYAAQYANQVNLEGNMPLHRPLRQSFGNRFSERDRNDGHARVPPLNETRSGPEVL